MQKTATTAIGGTLTFLGLVLIPLPGPGFLLLMPGVELLVFPLVLWLLSRTRAQSSTLGRASRRHVSATSRSSDRR